MTIRGNRVVLAAALSAAVLAAVPAWAQQREPNEAARSNEPPTAPTESVTEPAAEEQRGLLMDTLDRAGAAGPLEDARIRVFGYVEGSYTYNPDPTDHFEFGDISLDRLFDFESNQPLLNQINLTAERKVELTGSQWDVGFRTELIYGADARFIHSNGMNFYGEGAPLGASGYFQEHPENQFDLFQAYVDVGIPVGNGLGLRLGKFASFFGGTVDPNGNTFYSRSLIFASSHPFTFTGVLARYDVTRDLTVEAGFSRGWDQSLEDNNDALDLLMRVQYFIGQKTALAVAAVTGPEQDDDNGNYRTLLEATLKHQATDRLRLAITGTYGQDANAFVVNNEEEFVRDRDVRWYAVTGYTNLVVTDQITFNTRLEFLRDEKGFATGTPGNTLSGTLGLTIMPFHNDRVGRGLKVRPEVRLDYSPDDRYSGRILDDGSGNAIPDNDSNTQVTFGIDAILNF